MGEVAIRVVTRARRTQVDGERAGRVLVRVTAPPVDDAANAAVCKLVARQVGVPAGRVDVVRGTTSRDKVMCVEGVEDWAVRAALLGGPAR